MPKLVAQVKNNTTCPLLNYNKILRSDSSFASFRQTSAMSSQASAQVPQEPEHTLASIRETASSDQLKSERTSGSFQSPAREKVADMEVSDKTKPQVPSSKLGQKRGLTFWLILVALGSALCLVSIELVCVA